MAISLYDLSVASFLQTLGGVAGFLQRGLEHCGDNNTDPSGDCRDPAVWGHVAVPLSDRVRCAPFAWCDRGRAARPVRLALTPKQN